MTNLRRLKSDIATRDKRKTADKITMGSRNKNDVLTQERRFEADATLKKNRERNDGITADRRGMKDINKGTAITVSLIGLIVLSVVVYFTFF